MEKCLQFECSHFLPLIIIKQMITVSLVFQFLINEHMVTCCDCVTYHKEEFWVTAAYSAHIVIRCVGSGIQKKSRARDPLQWRSAAITAVLSNQSGVQFKPRVNCKTECSYYLTSYFNNTFHSTKILQLFMFCQYLLLLFLLLMFAKLYIFVCGACDYSFHLFLECVY